MTIEAQLDQIISLLKHRVAEPPRAGSPFAARPVSAAAATTPTETPATVRRSRVRPDVAATAPVAAEPTPVATTDTPIAVTAVADPFADAAPAPLAVTREDVRAAALALSAATSQDNAVAVIKAATGVSYPGLGPDQYGAALAAILSATPKAIDADPFAPTASASASPAASAAAPATAQEDAPSLDAVKAAIRKARQRTSDNVVQKIVIDNGGVAVNPSDGQRGISINALPISAYATVIAALNALPDTKTGK